MGSQNATRGEFPLRAGNCVINTPFKPEGQIHFNLRGWLEKVKIAAKYSNWRLRL